MQISTSSISFLAHDPEYWKPRYQVLGKQKQLPRLSEAADLGTFHSADSLL